MNCPDCRCKLEVIKTMVLGPVTHRIRQCACGSRFSTVEKVAGRLPAVTGNPPVDHRQPVARYSGSGSSLPPDSNPIASVPLDQTRVEPAKSPDYPNEFENMWRETGRRGHKEQAYRAWLKQGKPIAIEVVAAWKHYLLSLEEWRSPKDLSGWLGLKGHKQEWVPAKKTAADLRCHFHRSPGTNGKRPPSGWFASCPECKHARAGGGTRTGEPASIADLAEATEKRLAAARAVVPATREQLAELRSADAKH